MATRYIDNTTDYWLRVQLNPGPIISVPYGLKVDFIERKQITTSGFASALT